MRNCLNIQKTIVCGILQVMEDYELVFHLSVEILDLMEQGSDGSSERVIECLQQLIPDEVNETFEAPSILRDNLIGTPTTRSLIHLVHKILTSPRASNFLKTILNILAMSENKSLEEKLNENQLTPVQEEVVTDVKSQRWRNIQQMQQKATGLRRSKRLTIASTEELSVPDDNLNLSESTENKPFEKPNIEDVVVPTISKQRVTEELKMQHSFETDGPNSDLWESKMRPSIVGGVELQLANAQSFLLQPVLSTAAVPTTQNKAETEQPKTNNNKTKKKKQVPYAEHQVMLPNNFFRFPILEASQIPSSEKFINISPPDIPEWFSFALSNKQCLQEEEKRKESPITKIPISNLLFVANSSGNLFPLLEAFLCQSLFRSFIDHCKSKLLINYENYIALIKKQFPQFTNIHLPNLESKNVVDHESITLSFVENEFYELNTKSEKYFCSKQRYTRYLEQFIYFRNDTEHLNSLINDVKSDLIHSIQFNLTSSLNEIERLLICLLGNSHKFLREHATILLNCLYDRHTWQLNAPFVPKIRCIGDSFSIEINFTCPIENVSESLINKLIIAVSTPTSKNYKNIRFFKPIPYENSLIVELSSFTRSGYFDWCVGCIDPNGCYFTPLSDCNKLVDHEIWNDVKKNIFADHGRFIVHPSVRHDIFHEVFVDIEDAVWDRVNGGPIRRFGTFGNVQRALEDYSENDKITTIYLMGALERAEFGRGHPFSPINRATPNRASGGEEQFTELIDEVKKRNMKILVDATSRISIRGSHRKYRNLHCSTVDENGISNITIATDGAEQIWKDCQLLNYRKQKTWDLYIQDILQWAKLGVHGIRIESAHSCPLILKPDINELERMDSDGQFHYDLQEILDGDYVLPFTNEAYTFGYYGTNAFERDYPNPFFIKLTSTIWQNYPEFIFTGEVYWERHQNAIISGLIPFSTGISQALSSVFGTGLRKDGTIGRLPARRDVKAIYDWYELERTRYPQNSIVIYASSNHYSPYPVSLYGRGAWSAVDLLYFLPEIPATFVGEHGGWALEYDLYNRTFRHTSFDHSYSSLGEIRGHYVHRATMRSKISVLNDGGLILLYAKINPKTWHDRVFAFARFKLNKMVIIAINFNDVESTFYIDFSPLLNLFDVDHKIYKRVDFINPSFAPMYFSLDELLNEKQQVTLQPYKSMCWGIFAEIDSPAARRVLFEHSFNRLSYNLDQGIDPSHNLVYSDFCKAFNDSIEKFEEFVETFTQQLPLSSLERFPTLIRNALAVSIKSEKEGNHFIATLEYLKEKKNLSLNSIKNKPKLEADDDDANDLLVSGSTITKNPQFENIYQNIINRNSIGPIVFVTPEIGRFSKVGGIAVMVDELTQALVSLGCEIIVISPYYNFDRKGSTGYLKKEGVKHVKNIVAYVGHEAIEVGIHSLKENGVHYYFIHHFEYFPTPYNAGSSIHQLKTIVLMAKASLELCCQFRILPGLVISNDWFTGLVPAYGRKSSAFGTTFEGVTFFHLVHNLEEGYEGKIYLDGSDHLGYIHHLPRDIVVDPSCNQLCLNASRCALLSCNQWGTVSKSYCKDLMEGLNPSPLRYYLSKFPCPFAHSNGIRVEQRQAQLDLVAKNHTEAKEKLQIKYFGKYDPSIPLFSFVGRICLQKGVHLILNAVRELIDTHSSKLQIIVGGMANYKDPYAAQCAWTMQGLRTTYSKNFWADPNEFFNDGPLLNLGSDFALMPSLFEPSGVVQQEYFIGGTPVIAFKTGGLKDTVFEDPITGNGFTFEAHSHRDFVDAISRSIKIFSNADEYEKLRIRAKQSVLDMEDVAKAWACEFSRLRKCIWVDRKCVNDELKLLKQNFPLPVINDDNDDNDENNDSNKSNENDDADSKENKSE